MPTLLWNAIIAVFLIYFGYCARPYIDNVPMDEEEEIEGYAVEKGTESPLPTFTYCMNKDIKEAVQISSMSFPGWCLAENIDIIISPVPKIVVHKENGYNVIAKNTDYLIRDSDGDFYSCPAEMFEGAYQKVEKK